jgi:hypothetical protein
MQSLNESTAAQLQIGRDVYDDIFASRHCCNDLSCKLRAYVKSYQRTIECLLHDANQVVVVDALAGWLRLWPGLDVTVADLWHGDLPCSLSAVVL